MPYGGVSTIVGLPWARAARMPMRPTFFFPDASPGSTRAVLDDTCHDHDDAPTADMFTAIIQHDATVNVSLHDTLRWGTNAPA